MSGTLKRIRKFKLKFSTTAKKINLKKAEVRFTVSDSPATIEVGKILTAIIDNLSELLGT
jgi:hypothetical protein